MSVASGERRKESGWWGNWIFTVSLFCFFWSFYFVCCRTILLWNLIFHIHKHTWKKSSAMQVSIFRLPFALTVGERWLHTRGEGLRLTPAFQSFCMKHHQTPPAVPLNGSFCFIRKVEQTFIFWLPFGTCQKGQEGKFKNEGKNVLNLN